MKSIDYYAYASHLRGWNASYKVLLAFATLVVCIGANQIAVSSLVIVTMAGLTVGKGGLKFERYLSLLLIPLTFMALSGIAIALGVAREPLGQYNLSLHWFYLYTSNDDLGRTAELMLKALGAVSAMYMMVLSTPASEIITVLRKLHVPALVIELMNMIYRFIFILMDVQLHMKNSAQSRLGYCDFRTSCYSFGHSAGNLLVVSLKKANTYYDAMVSRGYDGELLFLEEEKPVKTIQLVCAALYLFLLAAVWFMAK